MTKVEIQEFLAHGTRTAKLATVSRSGAPHVMPVWFVLDGEELVLTTAAESIKGRNLRRDPRVAVVVDDDTPPFAFVHIRGRASVSEDLDELLRYATEIVELPNRGHALVIDSGWREVADTALEFVKRFA